MVNLLNQDQLDQEVKKDLNFLGFRIHKFFNSHHPRRHARSFKYAFSGVIHALLNEPNFRVQVVIVVVAAILGFYFKINTTEWGLLILTMGLLLFAELLNTVVEEFMDNLIPHKDPGARIIKDLSAGFVLIMAFTSLAILSLIFVKHFLVFFGV